VFDANQTCHIAYPQMFQELKSKILGKMQSQR